MHYVRPRELPRHAPGTIFATRRVVIYLLVAAALINLALGWAALRPGL